MKRAALLLAACTSICPTQPGSAPHRLALANVGPDSSFCFSQTHDIDLTSDETLVASFDPSCTPHLERNCNETHLSVVCPGDVTLSCTFYATDLHLDAWPGQCLHVLGPLTCRYDALLAPVSP